jgi:hypothetical protein
MGGALNGRRVAVRIDFEGRRGWWPRVAVLGRKEPIMLGGTRSVIVLVAAALGGVSVAGCAASRSEPYALTGRGDAKAAAVREERVVRYADSKSALRMENAALVREATR